MDTVLRPVRTFWPIIRPRARSGNLLPPSIIRRDTNRVIKAAIGELSAPHSERCISHGFRTGRLPGVEANRAPPWPVVASAVQWNSAALLIYANTAADVEMDMSNLMSNPLMSESEDELTRSPTLGFQGSGPL